MPKLASEFTQDISSIRNNCVYNKQAIGGAPVPTSVVAGGTPLTIIAGDPYVCTPVPPINTAPLGLPPCPAGTRTVRAVVNTSVLIDGKYPVIEGDTVNFDRPLTSGYLSDKIVIGTQIIT